MKICTWSAIASALKVKVIDSMIKLEQFGEVIVRLIRLKSSQ
jgi:hypothetical protein